MQPPTARRPGVIAEVLPRLSEDAAAALYLARAAVSEHGGRRVEVGHFLLGVLQAAPEGVRALLGSTSTVQGLSECLVPSVSSPRLPADSDEVPFSRGVEAVLVSAAKFADATAKAEVSTAELLLALIGDEGPTTECLGRAGISRETLAGSLRKMGR